MIGRYFLLFLGLVSLVWIGYVGSDLIDKKNQFSPSHIFGKEDGRILIINRLDEYSFTHFPFKLMPESSKLFTSIVPYLTNSKIVILSELQNHLFIQRTDDWDKEKVIAFFKKANLKVIFNSRHTFKIGKFEGKFNFSVMYLGFKNTKKPINKTDGWLNYDENSSGSIIQFNLKSTTVTDVYMKSNNQIQYVSKKFYSKFDKQVDDEQLFSVALPSGLINYHFYEKNYYASIYKKFNQSPLFDWVENGFVEFEYKGHVVILSDYKSGQDPIMLLNDKIGNNVASLNEIDGHFKYVRLTKKFPESVSLGFYIKTMDDFVVASTSQSVCEQVIADYKLGNTLGANKGRGESFFKELPQRVSERYVSDFKAYSNSSYRNTLIRTELITNNTITSSHETSEVINENDKPISMFIKGEVKDFKPFNGKGNVIALTKEGEVYMFENGKKTWMKNIGGEAIGGIQIIDFNSNGDKVFLCTSKNQIHLINKLGEELSGFPIILEDRASNEATFYRWNNSSNIIINTLKNRMIVFDSKGKKINSFKTGLSNVDSKIDVWVSNSILLAGIKDSKESVLFDLIRKREYRRFQIEENSFSIKKGNEMILYSIKNSQLISINQKGIKQNISKFNSGKIVMILKNDETQTIIVQSKNDLHFLNENGIEFKSLHLGFSELDDVQMFKNQNGIYYVSVIDGLANNVNVYSLTGELINAIPFDGKFKSFLTTIGTKELNVSSIVDNYIVQYSLKIP